MSSRGGIRLFGLIVAVVLAATLAWDERFRKLGVPLGLLALGLIALVAEGPGLISLAIGPRVAGPPPGSRPADGVVDLATMTSVEGVPLAPDRRWRGFVRLDDGPPDGVRHSPLSRENPVLLGRVALISVFVGQDGRAWTDAEVVQAHESLVNAGRWVEREARRWDAPVNIELADVFFRVEDEADEPVEVAFTAEGDDVGPMEANASSKAIAAASRAAARLGFADVVDLIRQINPRLQADARVWLFHLRRSGRSLAIPASDAEVPGVGLALCYAREASFPEPLKGRGRVDPTTVAHELLHLFGASDKYGVPLRSFAAGLVSSRDVMRLNFESLSRMTIDPLTGSEIGWNREAGAGSGDEKTARDR